MTDQKIRLRREELHAKLVTILKPVYYQSPGNTRMKYPCIVYDLVDIPAIKASNRNYFINHGYQITIIENTKDSSYAMKLLDEIPYARFANTYEVDGLYHTVFSVSHI